MTLALEPFGFELPLPAVLLGAIIGMTYGLLAVGLVLVYRSNGIINFAHGEIGAFGAALFATATSRWHLGYYLALPFAFAGAATVAAAAEVGVIRRLRNAPPLMSIVATLGVGQFLVFFSAAANPQAGTSRLFPSPPGLPEFQVGALRLTQAYVGMLLFAPLVVLGLALFLRRSRFGLAMRFSADNPDAARMAGIPVNRMSSFTWMLAGAVSAFTAILVIPSQGFASAASFGPALLLRALTAAVIAGMRRLPTALIAGVALGIVEQLLFWNRPQGGYVNLVLFVVMLVALFVQRGMTGRSDDRRGSWAVVVARRQLPRQLAALPEVRLAPWGMAFLGLLLGVALPWAVSESSMITLSTVMAFAMVGLSVALLTGLSGQLSLGQFAVAAVGGVISHHVIERTGWLPLALLYAGLGAAATSVVIGLPALRVKGLMLTVTTLGFGLVTSGWLLNQPWALADGVNVRRPELLGHSLAGGRSYYFFVFGLLVLVAALARNVKRSGLGRLLVAVRDNEENARAFSISARLVKLEGLLIAGFIAGIGGSAFAHLLSHVTPQAFPVSASIDVVAMAVLGGMSTIVGPLLGSFYVIGFPEFVPLDSAGLAATRLGWLVLILYLPGGLSQGFDPAWRRYLAWAAGRHGIVDDAAPSTETAGAPVLRLRRPDHSRHQLAGRVLLRACDLHKRFGGITAVDGFSTDVRAGQIVGLIGPNGAGKTTTFELLSGFVLPDEGEVHFDGQDLSGLGPERRARLGLIRSFQDAALFPTMTVLETAMLAFERAEPTRMAESVLGVRGRERRKEHMAIELIEEMGLGPYRYKQIRELSTGTRRITEIACLIALRPTLLLLDEPSSGIAQRETEALGELLLRIRRELELTMVVIEHDIPLIMGIADRVVVMDAGKVIAAGPPGIVREDPAVIDAYLGGSVAAIERSESRVVKALSEL